VPQSLQASPQDHGIDTWHFEHRKLLVSGSMQMKPFGT
jgi:hypothetical protein